MIFYLSNLISLEYLAIKIRTSILMFMDYRVFPDSEDMNPLSTKALIGFYIVGIGFTGHLIDWKWKLIGTIISLIACV